MRRLAVLMMVSTVVAATASVAGAKPSADRGKKGAAPVQVTIERATESTWALHEVDDVIIYDVSITTDAEITNVAVTGNVDFLGGTTFPVLPAGSTVVKASYTVVQADVAAGAVVGGVTVSYDEGDPVSASYTQQVDTSYKECVFELEGNDTWVKTAPNDDTCIFKPTKLVKANGTHPTAADAHWTFTVEPLRSTIVLFTMRDGIPGNWCKVPDPASGYYMAGPPAGYYDDGNDAVLAWDPEDIGGRGRWKVGDPAIVRHFYFPPGGSVPNELTGVCLDLGAGGDMIGVGNTESFYLVAPGTVTVQQRVEFP